MHLLSRLLHIDRRWIFLCIAAAVFVPFVTNLVFLQGTPTPATTSIYDYIEALPARTPILLIFDYGPAGMPEMHPMAMALMRQAFRKKLRLITLTIHPQGPRMAELALAEVLPEFKVRYGVDYVNLGFKPGSSAVILGLGSSFQSVYPTDTRGTPLSALEIMRGVHNYRDVGIGIDLATGSAPAAWIAFAHQRFGLPLAIGITAVMATDFYPYYQSGQLVGIINGMRGASEYEYMVKHPDVGSTGMSSQSVAHLVILLFVILGNVGYFAERARARRERAAG